MTIKILVQKYEIVLFVFFSPYYVHFKLSNQKIKKATNLKTRRYYLNPAKYWLLRPFEFILSSV